jgi:methyl-accepting chemotaxis protein
MKLAVNNVAVVTAGPAKELGRLIEASKEGQLRARQARAVPGRVCGDRARRQRTMLDAILLPIGEGNRILAQISAGKIDELIAQTYKGDHEKMKQAVNNVATVLQTCRRNLRRLIEASRRSASERGKPEQFQGAYC